MFSELINKLYFEHSYDAKKKLILNFLASTSDPDRGYGLAVLAGDLRFQHAKPNLIRKALLNRYDPYLFSLSYEYVGDLSETVALLWPDKPMQTQPSYNLTELILALGRLPKENLIPFISQVLDQSNYEQRWTFLKIITGSLRIGVSAQFIKNCLAEYGQIAVAEIQEIWPQSLPPYSELLAWLEHKGPKPHIHHYYFKPFMLSHPIDLAGLEKLDLKNFFAEWKWDGIRVQAIGGQDPALFSRTGDNILRSFPELEAPLEQLDAIIDGELMIRYPNGELGNFNALQQRLNRRTITPKMTAQFPAWIRCYDVLSIAGNDTRTLPFSERRQLLIELLTKLPDLPMDISPAVHFKSLQDLVKLRESSSNNLEPCEGIMLKAKDSLYLAGRKKGYWFKWKRDPFLIDAVLMYAQRGTGKRSSYYSDYTFGLWHGQQLLPVGKAYFGFTDEELRLLDNWVRQHIVASFGPVRQLQPKLVLEIAFEDVRASSRHRSGVALRFPRIHRIRWDKPANEADLLETLLELMRMRS